MKQNRIVELLGNNDVVILFFFHISLSIQHAETLARTNTANLRRLIRTRRIKPIVTSESIQLEYRTILFKDVTAVHKDKHNKNILYVVGNGFTFSLYIIKRG